MYPPDEKPVDSTLPRSAFVVENRCSMIDSTDCSSLLKSRFTEFCGNSPMMKSNASSSGAATMNP